MALRKRKVDVFVRVEQNRQLAEALDMKTTRPIKAAIASKLPDAFESPESSSIARATYDESAKMLLVGIKKGPNLTQEYVYSGVEPHQWAEFVTAKSKGQYFNTRIRPLFAGKPL